MSKYSFDNGQAKVGKLSDDFLNVFWEGNTGLGESESTWTDVNTHLNQVKALLSLS